MARVPRPQVHATTMLQYAARRVGATSLKRGRLCQWTASGWTQPQCRSRSAGPIAASDINVWANPESSRPMHPQEGSGAKATGGIEAGGFGRARTPTTLGRDVTRIVQSNQDILAPEVSARQATGGGINCSLALRIY